MVDALGFQHVERAPDVGGRPLFARMGDDMQAQCAATSEHARELLRRVAALAAVQAHANDFVQVRLRLFQRGKGVFLAEMAQETQNQRAGDTQLGTRFHAGAVQAAHHGFHGHAARSMRLRVEEKLGVRYVIHSCSRKVGAAQIVKILFMQQHAGTGVVDVEKALQVGEGVGAAQRFNAGVGQLHAIALGQGKDHLGLQRAFNVDVQLRLGHGTQQCGQALRRDGGNFEHRQSPEVAQPLCAQQAKKMRPGLTARAHAAARPDHSDTVTVW